VSALLLGLLLAGPAAAQTYVLPRRPGQTNVRWTAHDWQQIDLLAGQEIDGQTAGGIRLLFYESERASAEIAAARIELAYRELCEAFELVPPRRFPYILYGSYQEFLRTNLFPLQEGVLGVTSPSGLEVTLPYFGDHARFEEVSRHELAHQFTIQKVREATKDAPSMGDPIGAYPLWFIEGLAEFHAHGRLLDEETRAALTDLIANPDPSTGHALPSFFDDGRASVLLTYELGHARVAFLEEQYGEGFTLRLLEESPSLSSGAGGKALSFPGLLKKLSGEEPVVIAARFDTWIKRRLMPAWLRGELDPGSTLPFVRFEGLIDSMDSSPDGQVLLLRTAERSTGRYRLQLVDPRSPGTRRTVVRDGRPGSESLHPVDPRSYDLGPSTLVYVAERRGRDVLQLRSWSAEEKKVRKIDRQEAEHTGVPASPRVRLRLGRRQQLSLDGAGLGAVWSPSLSPDEGSVAFIAMGADGRRDLWSLRIADGQLRRLTEDIAAERELAWGPGQDGGSVIVYSSDASPDGSYDLFALDPEQPGVQARLDPGPLDVEDPTVLPDGTVLFTMVDDERRDLWAWTEAGAARQTRVTTSLSDPSPGAEGEWWALLKDTGRYWPVRLPPDERLPEPEPVQLAAPSPEIAAWEIPRRDLGEASPYRPYKLGNWGLENVFGMIGAGGGSIYGQGWLSATDRLRDRALVLQLAFYGSPQLTDASLLYIDQSRRTSLGAGPVSALRFHIEERFKDEGIRFQTARRFHSLLLMARYPFDRFVHLQVEQGLGFDDAWVDSATAAWLGDGEANGTGRDLFSEWQEDAGAARLQSESTLRVGVDTIAYHPATGPISGASAMLEGTLGVQPLHGEVFPSLRLDAEAYLPLHRGSGTNIALRGAAGSAWGGAQARSFYLYSPWSLRGVSMGDIDWLLGRNFVLSTAELQVPLDWLVRVAFLSAVEGIVGLDAGATADSPEQLWDRRLLDVAVGSNLSIGPLVFRLHFAHPLDIGAPLPDNPKPWVTNLSLGWLGT